VFEANWSLIAIYRADDGVFFREGVSNRCRAVGIDNESDQVPKGYSVDALALRGDEGRGTLR
jgi:hypothetical protein